jgi:hypothetical protein
MKGGGNFELKIFPPPYPNNLIIADFKEPKIQMNCGVFALFEAKEFKLIFELTAVEI